MALPDIFNKFRQWDNRSNQWFTKNFSVLFFEAILVVIFIFFIDIVINTINIADDVHKNNVIEQLLMNQSGLTLLIVLLLLFNSFLMLYMFNSILRLRAILKNVDFNLSRRSADRRGEDS